jgi:hypothetical protein
LPHARIGAQSLNDTPAGRRRLGSRMSPRKLHQARFPHLTLNRISAVELLCSRQARDISSFEDRLRIRGRRSRSRSQSRPIFWRRCEMASKMGQSRAPLINRVIYELAERILVNQGCPMSDYDADILLWSERQGSYSAAVPPAIWSTKPRWIGRTSPRRSRTWGAAWVGAVR